MTSKYTGTGVAMKTIAIYNSKGGVGKTTTAVNLAYLASTEGTRTLLWDLDPQAAATFYYRLPPKLKGGVKKLMGGKRSPLAYVKNAEYENLSLLPADFSARKLDIILYDMKKTKKRVRMLIDALSREHDLLFMDAPPGFSVLSQTVFRTADFILLPLIPTTLSIRTYLQITKYYEDKKLSLETIMPFFSLVDRRKKMHRETVALYGSEKNRFLSTYIPYSSEIERMGLSCAPLTASSPHSRAAVWYRELWEEIKTRMKLSRPYDA